MRNSTLQSHQRYPLTRLFGNGGNVRVLRALANYGGPLSASQLAEETGLTPPGTRLVLANLESQGMVAVLGRKGSRLFALDMRNPFAAPMKTLFAQESSRWTQLLEDLRATLRSHKAVVAAWLYGSVARGQDEPRSDMDVAVIVRGEPGPVGEALRAAVRPLEDREGVVLSIVALSLPELAARARRTRWWQELVRDAKPLKGSTPERVLAQRQHKVIA